MISIFKTGGATNINMNFEIFLLYYPQKVGGTRQAPQSPGCRYAGTLSTDL